MQTTTTCFVLANFSICKSTLKILVFPQCCFVIRFSGLTTAYPNGIVVLKILGRIAGYATQIIRTMSYAINCYSLFSPASLVRKYEALGTKLSFLLSGVLKLMS